MAAKTARPMTFREAITPKRKPVTVPTQRTNPAPAPAPRPVDPHLELLRQIARSTEQTRQWVAFWSILALTIAGLAVLFFVIASINNSY